MYVRCPTDTVLDRVEGVLPERIETLLADSLFQDSTILVVAALASGGINYLFQIAMGRLLRPENYGLFGSLFSLTYLATVLSAGVGYCATKYMSSLSDDRRPGFLTGFSLRVGALAVVLLATLLAAAPAVAEFLEIEDTTFIVLVVFSLTLSLFVGLNSDALRGVQRFVAMGTIDVGIASIKFLAGVALVTLGFGVYGAMGALIGATLFGVALSTFFLREYYAGEGDSFDSFGNVYRYALPSVLVAFCFTVPTNADIVLVKSMFTASQTGVYTAVSVFGKILVFLPDGISSALFPKVSSNHASGDETKHLLYRALLYTAVLAGSLAGVMALFPDTLLTLIFGTSYARGGTLLPWYGAMVAVFSLNLVFLNFTHARGDRAFVYVFAGLTAVELAAVYVVAESMLGVIQTMLSVNVVILLAGAALNVYKLNSR